MSKASVYLSIRGSNKEQEIEVIKKMSNGDLRYAKKPLLEILEEFEIFIKEMNK